VNKRRIIKAINYGYTLTRSFWFERSYLIVGKKSNVKLTQGKLLEPYEINISELDEDKFEKTTGIINITDYKDIEQSIDEINNYFESNKHIVKNRSIPILINISNSSNNSNIEYNKNIILEYIKNIILLNPLTSSNYLEFQIGKYFINLKDKKINTIETEYIANSDSELESIEELESDYKDEFTIYPTIILPEQSNCQIIKLNESGTAFIMINYLPNSIKEYLLDNFDTMWALHPETKHKIIMYENEVEVFRYSKSYLKTPTDLEITKTHSYMYSGFDTSDNNSDLPEQFVQVYNHMLNQDSKYNQVIANWYEDSNDYIAPHADCTKCMIPGAKISIVSIYPTEDPSSYRYLTVVPKYGKYSEKSIKKIRLDHGTIVTMCGTTQKEFLHSVDKCDVPISRRISLSFRQMI
jgi:alkylated DNA repair dioxygenase AlkB